MHTVCIVTSTRTILSRSSATSESSDSRTYIFPILAERMPQFAPNGDHLKEHEEIHHGLDEYVAYIKKCRKDYKEWDGEKMKRTMDSFRGVLFKHLDHEVESLKGDEMKKVGPVAWL